MANTIVSPRGRASSATADDGELRPGKWFALGDSYSSGEGTGAANMDPGTNNMFPPRQCVGGCRPDPDYPYSSCRRSAFAYPRVVAESLAAFQLTHRACSGAVIANVRSQTQEKEVCWPADQTCTTYRYHPPQISSVTSDAELITLTVGGNDALFDSVLTRCIVGSCQGAIAEGRATFPKMRQDLVGLYRALLDRAPNATLMVLTYPQAVERTATANADCAFARDDLDHLVDFELALNTQIEAAVVDARQGQVGVGRNSDIQTVDLWNAFSGKGDRMCHSGGGGALVNGVTFGAGDRFRDSGHPTILGYRAMSLPLSTAITNRLRSDAPPGAGIDTVLTIDSSGSMVDNDPRDDRLTAAKLYLGAASPGDHVGLVDFDDVARVLSDPITVPAGGEELRTHIGGIDSVGGTNLGAAIQAACEALGRSPSHNQSKAALLLTDGDGAYSGEAGCFVDHGWKLYAVGVGAANAALLSEVTATTGGRYIAQDDPAALGCEFQNVRAEISGVPPSSCASTHIDPGETIRRSVEVAPRTASLALSITWPGSDVRLTATSPSGRAYHRDDLSADFTHDRGATYEVLTVPSPEPGTWDVAIHALDVDAGGEPVFFTPTAVPAGGAAPTAVLQSTSPSGLAPLTVTFDATGSTDPDGPVTILWDLDGDERVATDARVEHTFVKAGTYQVTLMVQDSDGETATATRTITVTEQPDTGYVRKLYRDFLVREPEPAGLAYWSQHLAAGRSRAAVARSVIATSEVRKVIVALAHRHFLDRQASSAEIAHWTRALTQGATLETIERAIALTPEFWAHAGGTNGAFVRSLHRIVLDRSPTGAEAASDVALLTSMGRRSFVLQFFSREEVLVRKVRLAYTSVLERPAEPAGSAYWARELRRGVGRLRMVFLFATLPEYAELATQGSSARRSVIEDALYGT